MNGYKLVPVEPTPKMLQVWKSMHGYSRYNKYQAMLDAAPAVQGEPVPHTFYVLHDTTEGQKYIQKNIDDGCLLIFEREEDAQRAKCRHPGTEYTRVDYYTAPHPAERQPDVTQLVADAEFLLNRLRDMEGDLTDGELARSYMGHVAPAIGRLEVRVATHRKQGDGK